MFRSRSGHNPALVMALLATASHGESQALARGVKGVAVDATGAGLPGALVRLLDSASNAVITRGSADSEGKFQIGAVPSGSYTVVLWVQGFRARRVPAVIRTGEISDVGKLRLGLAGCDAPGVICDSFGTDPPDSIVSKAYLQVKDGCEVALAVGKVACPDSARGRTAETELRLMKIGGGIYLSAMNGAALAQANLPRSDCRDANASESVVRTDGFGPGDDICVQTHDWSHLFFVEDVGLGSQGVEVWQVTRRR